MNGIVFYIGLGLGLATACGLRPYLPTLLAGALGSAGALGLGFAHSRFRFLQAGWWLVAVCVVFAGTYAAVLLAYRRSRSEQRIARALAPLISAHAIAAGALLFAGTLAAHRDAWWPGLIAGAGAAALARAAVEPLVAGARSRLRDRAAREALAIYLDAASLAAAVLVALLHPLGYLAAALAVMLLLRVRARAGAKYAGLRVMRR